MATTLAYTTIEHVLSQESVFDHCSTSIKLYAQSLQQLNNQKAKESLAGLSLLILLCQHQGIDCASLLYEKGITGKPGFSNASTIQFNITHSGDYVGVILNTEHQSVGMDIESKIPQNAQRIVSRFLSPEDESILESDPTDKTFLKLWTKRESIGKCVGNGFLEGMRSSFSGSTLSTFILEEPPVCLCYAKSKSGSEPINTFKYEDGTFKTVSLEWSAI